MALKKNIRSEVLPRDRSDRSELDSSPVFRIKEDALLDPERDGLLADLPEVREVVSLPVLPDLGGERRLAPGDVDGPDQGGGMGRNVVLLHDGARLYTRNLVSVNKISCFHGDKERCTVLDMPIAKRKPVAPPQRPSKRRRTPEPEVGPDGRTLAQRVILLMTERNIGQTELARMCSQYYATFVPTAEDKVKQQHIFNLLQGQSSSWAVPLIAAVFDVSDIWLQYGIGDRDRRIKN